VNGFAYQLIVHRSSWGEAILTLLRPILRIVRNAGMAIVEQFWLLGFALAGRAMRPAARRWSSPGGQRVLAVAPHPDDEAIGCGGALARHSACGDQVCIAYITDGRRSRALGLGPAEMAVRRRAEAMESAAALGAGRVEWLGLAEGEWTDEQFRASLRALLRQLAPQLIYAPSRVDFHPEHARVACALALALADAPADTRVRVYQVQVPLTPALTNLVADISGVIAANTAALRAYATQQINVGRAIRQRHYAAALYGLRRQAEEFCELSIEQYAGLHADLSGWSGERFRGLRFYPFSDPLAYLRGRAERRRMADLVQGAYTREAGSSEMLKK
jgi:LmbE family N-acetylglucosaminyl deacetylase